MLKLPSELQSKFRIGAALPCNPCTIASRTLDFTKLTTAEAEWLLRIGSPHIVKIEHEESNTKKDKKAIVQPVVKA